MKYIFLISAFFQFLDFTVLASDPLEDYYKSIIVLDVNHEKFTSHLRDGYLQNTLGGRAIDYSITTLAFEDEKKVPYLIMRKDDIRWHHLYFSATPYVPPTLLQNFSNGFSWYLAFREMLNFRAGAITYKKQGKYELSEHCSVMAAYLTIYQLILKQDRLYEFGNIVDSILEDTSIFTWSKPVKDTSTGKDALATAKNMELLSKVTEVLNEIMDYRVVRRQLPIPPTDPWIFPSNEKQAEQRPSAVDIVKEELAVDFYLREPLEDEQAGAGLAKQLQGLEVAKPPSEISEMKDIERLEQPPMAETRIESTKFKEQASSSKASEETTSKKEEPSEKEKEIEWLKHSKGLKGIDDKYTNNLGENDDVFYYKCVWKELLTIYGDAFVQVTEYFHFAISGSSYDSTVKHWTNSFEDYVPNMDESAAVWEKAEELFRIAKVDYQMGKSSKETALKSHPITILQSIEKIRLMHRNKEAVIDESQTQREWTLNYVNPKQGSADLIVSVV